MILPKETTTDSNAEPLHLLVDIDRRAKKLVDIRLLRIPEILIEDLVDIISTEVFSSAQESYSRLMPKQENILFTREQARNCRKVVRKVLMEIETDMAEYLRLTLVAMAVGALLQESNLSLDAMAKMDDSSFRTFFNDFFGRRFCTDEVKASSLKNHVASLKELILQTLELHKRSTDQLEYLLGLRDDERQKIKIDSVRSRLIPEFLMVDSSLIYHKFRESLYDGGWHIPEGKSFPTHDLSSDNRKIRAVAEVKPDPDQLLPSIENDDLAKWQYRMWEHVSVMDDLAADISDITNALWLKNAKHASDRVWVTADDISRFRGLKPQKNSSTGRRGGFKTEPKRLSLIHI